MKITHTIKPVDINPRHYPSYLHVAQPITLDSMVRAKQVAEEAIPELEIDLHAVLHVDENISLPREFRLDPRITRYIHDVVNVPDTTDLVFLKDILQCSLISHYYGTEIKNDADWIIYTNVDIGLYPNFYKFIYNRIKDNRAPFCINKRILPKQIEGHGIITVDNYKELVPGLKSDKHPGLDCFVFPTPKKPITALRNIYGPGPFIGTGYIGQVFYHWMKRQFSYKQDKPDILKNEHVTFHLGEDLAWAQKKNSKFEEMNKILSDGMIPDSKSFLRQKKLANR